MSDTDTAWGEWLERNYVDPNEKEDPVKLVRVGEFEWTDDYSFMRTMTCINHPTARYSTKNPYFRSLFIVKLPEGDIERTATGECTCPISDLVVLVEETEVTE